MTHPCAGLREKRQTAYACISRQAALTNKEWFCRPLPVVLAHPALVSLLCVPPTNIHVLCCLACTCRWLDYHLSLDSQGPTVGVPVTYAAPASAFTAVSLQQPSLSAAAQPQALGTKNLSGRASAGGEGRWTSTSTVSVAIEAWRGSVVCDTLAVSSNSRLLVCYQQGANNVSTRLPVVSFLHCASNCICRVPVPTVPSYPTCGCGSRQCQSDRCQVLTQPVLPSWQPCWGVLPRTAAPQQQTLCSTLNCLGLCCHMHSTTTRLARRQQQQQHLLLTGRLVRTKQDACGLEQSSLMHQPRWLHGCCSRII